MVVSATVLGKYRVNATVRAGNIVQRDPNAGAAPGAV